MGTTTTKGYKLPTKGNADFWSQLEFDIQRLNDHKHDNIDSQPLSPPSIVKSVQTVSAGSWVAVPGQAGTFKQTLTVPATYAVDGMIVKFFVDGGGEDGHQIFPSIQKVSSLTFDIFINDNSVALKAVYG